MVDVNKLLLSPGSTIRQAMQRIDTGGKGIVLLVDDQQRLRQTITDGDVRRAILAGISLDATIDDLIAQEPRKRSGPITASHELPPDKCLQLMQETEIHQLPLVDDEGRVVKLLMLDEMVPTAGLGVQAVIMAGGFGTRLRPLTDNTPKPMLEINGRPLMERTIERLRQAGISRINVTTHYMPEKITNYFGTGTRFGVDLNYVAEDQPLGTAGSLGLVGATEEPLLVMNGDILTTVDFRSLLSFHKQHDADLTVAVRQYDVQVPYGVIEATDGYVGRLQEKPKIEFLVNAGIYLLEPNVRKWIPPGERFDMTDLINCLLEHKRKVASFPIVEYWLDIGKHDDFQQAQTDAELRWAG